jgi:ABC-type multidrug transport system ATPase subunit
VLTPLCSVLPYCRCADTRVGNQFIPGLSGGQKRRLSLAVLLVRRPALIFLDEPTSGLDAAAAFQIMNFVRELARDLKIVVIATLHQPAASVFNDFSGALILSNGRVAYQVPSLKIQPSSTVY